MKEKVPSQMEQIKGLLESRGSSGLTQYDAMIMVKPMCTRLAAYICVLRKRGWEIETLKIPRKSGRGYYAFYILKKRGNE